LFSGCHRRISAHIRIFEFVAARGNLVQRGGFSTEALGERGGHGNRVPKHRRLCIRLCQQFVQSLRPGRQGVGEVVRGHLQLPKRSPNACLQFIMFDPIANNFVEFRGEPPHHASTENPRCHKADA
jgi:hypothetical protein